MGIAWGSLAIVCLVSLAAGVAVVVLVAFALVGLSSRVPQTAGGGAAPAMSPAAGTAVAAVCFAAVLAIIVYGLYVIIA